MDDGIIQNQLKHPTKTVNLSFFQSNLLLPLKFLNGVSTPKNILLNDTDYEKTISTEELIKQIEEISSILKKHGFYTVSKQYDMIKAKINSTLWR